MKAFFVALLLAGLTHPAFAAYHGTCSLYLPSTYYTSLGLTDGWTTTGVTLNTGSPSAPTCGGGATSVDDTSTGFHNIGQTVVSSAPATTYVLSVFAKRAVGTDNIEVALFDEFFANSAGAIIDLGSCSVHSSSGGAINLIGTTTSLVNGWCHITETLSTPFNNIQLSVQLLNANASFALNYAGDGSSSVALWGVDLRPGTTPISVGDRTNYYTSFYTGFLAPFSGVEVTPNIMNIQPPLFPGGTTISWNYSATPCGVCGYLQISYANYDGTTAAVPVPPIQVSNLTGATVSSSILFSGDIAHYDVIYDTFLFPTSTPTTPQTEFEVFLHTNTQVLNYVQSETQIGTVTISGISWTVAVDPLGGSGWHDVLFMPAIAATDLNAADITSGTIDLLAMINYAIVHTSVTGVTGSEWFTGTSLGAEPQQGNGTLAINSFKAMSPIIIGDSTNYSSGVYTGYLTPFGGGVEVTPNQMVINDPSVFPSNVTINWNYSSTPCTSICGFLAIDYGNYSDTVPQTPVTPIQVNNLNSVTETHNVAFSGTSSGYDAIDDMFLYVDSAGTTRAEEFEVFLHTPAYSASYVLGVTQVGTTTISGVAWTVAVDTTATPHDILFMPTNQADVPNATIDLKAMLLYAKSQGLITGNEWFTGMAIGIEPKANGGSMAISAFSAESN